MNHLDTTDFLDNVRRSTRSTRTIAGMARVAINLTTDPLCLQGQPRKRLAFCCMPGDPDTLITHDRVYVTHTPGAIHLFESLRDRGSNTARLESDELDFGDLDADATACHEITLAAMQAHLSTLGIVTRVSRPSLLASRRVNFHNDPYFGSPAVLFCITSLKCDGDLVFPNLRLRIPFPPGATVAFDPLEPHGITIPNGSSLYEGGVAVLSGDLQIDEEQARIIGLCSTSDALPSRHYQIGPQGLWQRKTSPVPPRRPRAPSPPKRPCATLSTRRAISPRTRTGSATTT